MAIRNTVSIEFTVSGPGMAQLEQIAARLRGLGGASGSVGTASAAIGRLGQVSATSAGHVNRATGAVRNLGAATGRAAGAMSRIGEIMLGSFGGNVLAGIFTSAAAAAANFAKESVGAALSAEQALVVLKTQSRLTGTSLEANIELAKKLAKEFRISDTAGLGIVGAGTKFTSSAGKPDDTLKFLRAVADLSAAAGRPLSDLQETLRQLAAGGAVQESALDKIGGGVNPSQIFEAFGKSVGVASDKLTEAQRSLAIYNFLMERAGKVQGVAQESMNTTTGRISALSAAYDNLQERLGKLIVSSPLFQKGLEGIESVAARLNTPEATAWGDKMSASFDVIIAKSKTVASQFVVIYETISRGAGVATAEFTRLADQISIIWDTVAAKVGNAFKQISLEIRQFANQAMLSLIATIDAIPAPAKAALGLGNVDTGPALNEALKDQAETDNRLQAIYAQNAGLDASAGARLAKTQTDFNRAIAALPKIGSGALPDLFSGGATAAQIANLAGATGGAAGSFLKEFKRVPVVIETENGLQTVMGYQRVAREQAAASTDLAAKTVALTAIMEEVQKNPLLGRIEIVAGESTIIKSVVPTGYADGPIFRP